VATPGCSLLCLEGKKAVFPSLKSNNSLYRVLQVVEVAREEEAEK